MKKLLLSLILVVSLTASAQTYNFTTCGVSGQNGPTQTDVNTAYAATNLNGMVTVNVQGYQEWVVPTSGTYSIQAVGASGGNSTWGGTVLGGAGADMYGEFNLTAGQVVIIVVGQQGESDAVGGGGGGTYVAIGATPYIVAGGGGGASSDQAGISAVATQDGTYCSMNVIAGGTGGNGGNACTTSDNNGGGGGGFYTDGVTPNTGGSNNNGFGGLSFLNGGIGGQPGRMDGACSEDAWGGFGGGGSTTCNTVGGGGGGGYSGGAGGQHYGNCGGGSIRAGGGGGGSYNNGSNQNNIAASNTGDGYVTIMSLCSPTSITPDVATLTDITEECSSTPTAPTATNDCGSVIPGTPDVVFPVTTMGTTVVTWTYDDGSGNVTSQQQNVIITDTNAPVADSASLPDLMNICGDSLVPPTATDACMGPITATTNAPQPYTVAGTSTITWTFDDGNGNTSTQIQTVINGAIDNTVSQSGTQLSSNQLVAAYQWLDCDNSYAQMAGEVNQHYTPAVTGNYAVEITVGGCVDTSACTLIDYTGLDEIGLNDLNIYPNPSVTGDYTISFNGTIEGIEIFDVLGRKIELPVSIENRTIDGSTLESGKYIVRITSNAGTYSREIIKLD